MFYGDHVSIQIGSILNNNKKLDKKINYNEILLKELPTKWNLERY